MGAVASGGAVVLNDEVLRLLPAGSDTLERVKGRELLELARREQAYRGDREPLAVRGRTCIVVDDGLATGATMAAALRAMQNSQAGRIVAAVPVASSEALERIAAIADEVVCPHAPPWFSAVGHWYERFDQTEDDEVRELMSQAAGPPAARESRDNLPPRA
jgi:putative phosphoribosyl transferase